MLRLSIIVPVYNVEKYLLRCIKSIITQEYSEFELILVEDGSLDHCAELLDASIMNDERVIVIHQKNKGVSAARNAGLSIARGEYIGFVDPDDWIEPDMYEVLINAIQTDNCDIAGCSWMDNYPNGEEKEYYAHLETKVMNCEEFAKHLFDAPPTLAGSVCSKIFRRGIIPNGFSEKYFICEDNLFVTQCVANCKRGIYVNKALYHVFCRDDSATRKQPGKVAYGLAARKEIINVAKTINSVCGMLAEKIFLDQCITYMTREDLKGSPYQEYARDEYIRYLKGNRTSVLRNQTIKWKQKIFFIFQFIKNH